MTDDTTKAAKLRSLLESDRPEYIMEAHSGIAARVVEEAGFPGIWGSGLSISACLGVRDNNEASWTQVLEMVEFMSDATDIPLLLDGDTGYGNFNNARRLVTKLEQRDIAGVCLEDKLFPKTNSFIGGEKQPLADPREFAGKIRAIKDTQRDEDFVVVARTEALIAGWGVDEAIDRAMRYQNAGADAILVHSKERTVDPVRSFVDAWSGSVPLVVVPTTYYETDPEVFEELGISLVVWGNHMLRSSIQAMQDKARVVKEARSVEPIVDDIVSVSDVFDLQDVDELRKAEQRYLPQQDAPKAIILAASRGPEFGELTEDKPKTMVEVGGEGMLEKIHRTLNEAGVKDVTAVLGYEADTVDIDNLDRILHPEWEDTGNAYTLYQAIDRLEGPVVVSYGDIVYERHVLEDLLDTPHDIVLAVDTSWTNNPVERVDVRHVICEDSYSDSYGSPRCTQVENVGFDIPKEESSGEWIGLIKLSSEGTRTLRNHLKRLFDDPSDEELQYTVEDLLGDMMDQGVDIHANYFIGHWLDLDNRDDLERYRAMKAERGG